MAMQAIVMEKEKQWQRVDEEEKRKMEEGLRRIHGIMDGVKEELVQ